MSGNYHKYFVIAKSDSLFLSLSNLYDKQSRYVDIENASWFSSASSLLLQPYETNAYTIGLENSNTQEFIFKKYIADDLRIKSSNNIYLMNFAKIAHHHFKGNHSHKYIVMTYPIPEEPPSLFDNDDVMFTGNILSSNITIISYFVKDDTSLTLFKLTNANDIVSIFERLSDNTITTRVWE